MEEKIKKPGGAGFPACAKEDELSIRHRDLPHWQLPGSTYFVTFRLKSGIISENERRVVLDAIKHFHVIRYWVTAAIIMPDHVHLLLTPNATESEKEFSLGKILNGIKGCSAREINKFRGSKGALWLDESYDRIVRDYDEYLEKWHYIRDNPVRAELCQSSEEYDFLWEPGEHQE